MTENSSAPSNLEKGMYAVEEAMIRAAEVPVRLLRSRTGKVFVAGGLGFMLALGVAKPTKEPTIVQPDKQKPASITLEVPASRLQGLVLTPFSEIGKDIEGDTRLKQAIVELENLSNVSHNMSFPVSKTSHNP